MSIRVIVNGALGKMGQQTIKAVTLNPELELVGSAEKNDNLADLINKTKADVVVDFTHPSAGFNNAKIIIANNARPVIGTTGFQIEQINELKDLCQTKKLGGIIAPNFSIGAILMMKFSREAARYYQHAEIIELHHNNKADSPSGTAIKTAELIANVREEANKKIEDKMTIPHARGADYKNIAIHAVRLPGLVANQEVIFGGVGETLKICHTTIDREAFMPGVILACKKVMQLQELIYGLEEII